MKTKIFTRNKNNKIEFTEKQLKDLLDEIYNDGYNDGRNSVNYIYTTPYRGWWNTTTPLYCTTSTLTSDDTITINTSNTTSGCVLSNNDENQNEYKWTSTTYKTKK